jgi:thiol:disulfide interchange protein DsbA
MENQEFLYRVHCAREKQMKETSNHRSGLHAILIGLATLLLAGAVQAQGAVPYQEGLHYFEIENAKANTGGKIELVEAFSYMCTHCNTFEPYINSWKSRKPENVEFRRIPVIFGRGSWELYARAYVTAEMMGIVEETHGPMMERIWKDREIMRNMDQLAEFYSGFGVEAGEFTGTSKSFAVDAKIRKDQRLVQDYGIRGTPTLVVNGKYRVAGNAAVPSFDVMLDVVDFLIAKESTAMQAQEVQVSEQAVEVAAESGADAGQ